MRRLLILAVLTASLAATGAGATAYYEPTGDVATGWQCQGSSCSTGQYAVLDDGVRQPTAPVTGDDYIYLGSSTSEVSFPTATEDDINSITLWAYIQTPNNDGFNFNLHEDYYRAGQYVSQNGPAWHSVSFSPSPSNNLNDLRARFENCGANACRVYATYLEVDYTAPPRMEYTAPTPTDGAFQNQTYAYVNTSIEADTTVTSCTLEFDGSNSSVTPITSGNNAICGKNTTGLSEGSHSFRMYSTDGNGRSSVTATRSITIDTTTPNISLSSPPDNAQNRDKEEVFEYTPTDNIDTSLSCSLYIDGQLEKSQTTANGTTDTFGVTGLSETTHTWRVDCTDDAGNTGQSPTRSFEVDVSPNLGTLTAATDPIRGGAEQIITPDSIGDPNNDALQFRCAYTKSAVLSGTTICKETTTSYAPPYSSAQCSFDTRTIDGTETVYCAAYDTEYYSSATTSNFTIDSTPPSLTTDSVASDQASPYIDSTDDGHTTITVSGESGMQCRFSTTDTTYSGMSSINQCTINGSTATCSPDPAQGFPDLYVACQDSLGNENDAASNLDITDLLVDHTPPTTTTDAAAGVHLPRYTVNLTEADNVDADPDTTYCIDQTNSCSPSTGIDDGQSITFTASDRGTNYLRISSTDDAGNTNLTATTIEINELPTFSAAQDDAGTIQGGDTVTVTTTASDPDGQDLSLYVCRTPGSTAGGCTEQSWCSNTTATTDPRCSFTAPRDDTTHDWYAYVYDSAGEAATGNHRNGSFTTDSTGPVITIDDPDNITYTQQNVPAGITTSETAQTAYYTLNGANSTMSEVSPTSFSSTISGLTTGPYSVSFWAQDQYGNWRKSAYRYFSVNLTGVDTTPPTLTVRSPLNGSFHSGPVLFNVTADEVLEQMVYSLDGGTNISMGNTSRTAWNATVTPTEGRHTVRFYANDTATTPNLGTAGPVTFTYDTTPPRYQRTGISPASPRDNTSVTCQSYWTDAVALDTGIVAENSSGSFVNHTLALSGTADWLNHTIPASSLPPGTVTCRSYVNDTTGNTNVTTTTFSVADVTPPAITDITAAPATADGLDPGVRVNVTGNVSDASGIASVMLQYRNSTATDWTNVTMSPTNGTGYTGSFTPVYTDDWAYRVRATDTSGLVTVTAGTMLTVANETGLTITDTIPEAVSRVVTDPPAMDLGNLTLTNTGDTPVTVTADSNVSWVAFDDIGSLTTSIAPGTTIDVAVTANTTGFPVSRFPFRINTTATHGGTAVNTSTTTGTIIIQQVAGPLLALELVQFSSAVTRGQSGITYQVRVRNIGTASASGTWLAWELPSAFTLQSGVLNRSVGTLLPGGSSTNTITVQIPASVSDQRVTLTARTASGGVTDVLSQQVTIGDPTIIRTGDDDDGGGGGVRTVPSGETAENVLRGRRVLNSTRRIHVLRGNSTSFPVSITNIFEGTLLQNLSVSVDGLPPGAVTIDVPDHGRLAYNESMTATVTITGPSYLQAGTRELTVTLSGRLLDDSYAPGSRINQTFVDERFITLIIHSISQQAASAAIDNATATLARVEADQGARRLEQLVQRARQQLDARDYDQAHALAQQVRELAHAAHRTRQLLTELEEDLAAATDDPASRYGLGPDYSTVRELMRLAEAAAARGDYQTALERAEQARTAFRQQQARSYPVATAVNHWKQLVVGLVALIVTGLVVAYLTRRRRLARQIRRLDREEDRLLEELVELQERYYQDEELSTDQYEQRQDRIQDRLADLREERIGLRKQVPLRYGLRRTLDRLEEERDEVLDRLRSLQERYYEKETIGKRRFERETDALESRLAEIEQETTRIRIQQHLRDER